MPGPKPINYELNHNTTNFAENVLSKNIFENRTKTQKVKDCVLNSFSEGKNSNPTKHCEHHRPIKKKNYVEI